MRFSVGPWLAAAALFMAGCASTTPDRIACVEMTAAGFRPIANERATRFLGKVREETAQCRGGDKAVAGR